MKMIMSLEHVDKAKVLQDARIFHDSILVRERPDECRKILCQILHLQNESSSSSSKLTKAEATDLFFASTKLFVCTDDAPLRRLVYLFIKEIQPLCDPSDVIIVTSCLTRDMTSLVGLYRANSIRVLVGIIDSAMLGSIERYIKQAIVDNDDAVRNAALVAASHLFSQSTDNATIIRRWVGEVQVALDAKHEMRGDGATKIINENIMVQANATRLLLQMKSHDRLGMAKLVQKYGARAGGVHLRSPMAIVILMRLCSKLLIEEIRSVCRDRGDGGGGNDTWDVREVSSLGELCFDYLECGLSNSNGMLSYEAARAICSLPNLGMANMSLAMEFLRGMLFSDKYIVRLAAVRTLSNVSQARALALCNEGLELCAGDDDAHLATLAIITLLRAGSEATIDRILGNVSSLFHRIADDNKITLLQSLVELCINYPRKHEAIVSILSSLLHEEGGFDFKHSIVNCIVSLIRHVPESTERNLLLLCEFIEDCEYAMLSTKAMHIIADIGPTTTTPSRYIRSICNRVILENATIRAAAISALAKFAASCPSLRQSILTLLKKCLNDEDDETRDRTAVAVSVLKEAMIMNPYIPPSLDDYDAGEKESPAEGDLAAMIYLRPLPMSFNRLEQSVVAYASTPGAIENAEPITFFSLPFIEEINEDNGLTTDITFEQANLDVRDPAAAVYAIPELADFGRVFRSSIVIPLTEEETEYFIRYIKHILDHHVILEFIITNTVEGIRIENLTVELEGDSNTFEIVGDVPAAKVECGETVSTFTVLNRRADSFEPTCFTCQLNFTAVGVCPDSGEQLGERYAEEYPLEPLTITPSDFMGAMTVSDFRQAWNGADVGSEALGTFTVQAKSIGAVVELMGMTPCDGTSRPPADASQHTLHLSGMFLGGHVVLARAQLMSRKDGNMLRIAIRSDNKDVSDTVMRCIH
jgi:coatomer protein complex subunit gamma